MLICSTGQTEPAGHGEQTDWPAIEVYPSRQGRAEVDPRGHLWLMGQGTTGSPLIQSEPAGQAEQPAELTALVAAVKVPSGQGNWSGYHVFRGQKWFGAQAIGATEFSGQAEPAGHYIQSRFTPRPAVEYVPGGQIKSVGLLLPSGQ